MPEGSSRKLVENHRSCGAAEPKPLSAGGTKTFFKRLLLSSRRASTS